MSDIVERLLSASHDERLSDGMLYREAGEILQACKPYLKDGETPAECIQRNRSDVGSVMSLLAKEKFRIEAAQKLADDVYEILEQSPELNMGNYTDAEVADLNNAVIEAYPIIEQLREALGGNTD